VLGLSSTLRQHRALLEPDSDGGLRVTDQFATPGYWTTLAARAFESQLPRDRLSFPDATKEGYAKALALPRAIWGIDEYEQDRLREGERYSTLQHLDQREATDSATRSINQCLRQFIGEQFPDRFVRQLCDVVGDLHDNVWSHGEGSGFSMAQRWNVPRSEGQDEYLEFALADVGRGFLRELRRVGMADIEGDTGAIAWCIQEGHSSKRLRREDDWEQTLPEDADRMPMPGAGVRRDTGGNHHMGLGLHKFIDLARRAHGRLWLATGSSMLEIAPDGSRRYHDLDVPWQGVALACCFKSSRIAGAASEQTDETLGEIIQGLTSDDG
jgi:hypothetical protein